MRRLQEFDVVELNLPPERTRVRLTYLRCTVLAVEGATAALEPFNRSDASGLPEETPNTIMTFQVGTQLVGLRGDLLARRSGRDLRFRVTDGVQLPRRSATRLTISAPVVLTTSSGVREDALTVDLSAGGMLILTNMDAQVGERIKVRLSLPGMDMEVDTVASVARKVDDQLGMQIDSSDRDARSMIATFVIEHNRATLRRKRTDTVGRDF